MSQKNTNHGGSQIELLQEINDNVRKLRRTMLIGSILKFAAIGIPLIIAAITLPRALASFSGQLPFGAMGGDPAAVFEQLQQLQGVNGEQIDPNVYLEELYKQNGLTPEQ